MVKVTWDKDVLATSFLFSKQLFQLSCFICFYWNVVEIYQIYEMFYDHNFRLASSVLLKPNEIDK